MRYILEYARDWYRAALWTYDYGLISWRLDLAACLGALIGFIMIVSGVTPFWHFTLIALLIGVTVLVSRKYLQEDVAVESPEEEKEAEKKEAPALLSFIRKPEMLLIQLGIVGLFALVVESAMFDWSGLYFESVLQVPKSLQIGFLVFMVMMTVGRFLTNSAYSVLGSRRCCNWRVSLFLPVSLSQPCWAVCSNR